MLASEEHAPQRSRPAIALSLASDERLAALAAAGNARAFAAIYSRYHQRLYRYCRTLLREDADAQDALQSAFTAALTSLRTQGPPVAPLRPWLFRIVHNESVSILRRAQRRAADPLDDSIVGTGDPASEMAKRQEFEALVADLHELPERQRGALVMRELNGLSHEEIGVALQTSTATAKQTIFEARRSMMELAAGRELDCGTIRGLISDSDADGRTMRSRRVRGHLRDCAGCTVFAEQLRSRRQTFQAYAPVLPLAASTALLHTVLGGGTGAGASATGAGASAGAGMSSTGAGMSATGKLALASLGTKTLAGAAVTITAGIAIGGVVVTGALQSKHHHGASGRVTKLSGAHASAGTAAAAGQGAASRAAAGPPGTAGSAASSFKSGAKQRAQSQLQSTHATRAATHGAATGAALLGATAAPGQAKHGATTTPTPNGNALGAAQGIKTRAHGSPVSKPTNTHTTGKPATTPATSHAGGNGGSTGSKTQSHGAGSTSNSGSHTATTPATSNGTHAGGSGSTTQQTQPTHTQPTQTQPTHTQPTQTQPTHTSTGKSPQSTTASTTSTTTPTPSHGKK